MVCDPLNKKRGRRGLTGRDHFFDAKGRAVIKAVTDRTGALLMKNPIMARAFREEFGGDVKPKQIVDEMLSQVQAEVTKHETIISTVLEKGADPVQRQIASMMWRAISQGKNPGQQVYKDYVADIHARIEELAKAMPEDQRTRLMKHLAGGEKTAQYPEGTPGVLEIARQKMEQFTAEQLAIGLPVDPRNVGGEGRTYMPNYYDPPGTETIGGKSFYKSSFGRKLGLSRSEMRGTKMKVTNRYGVFNSENTLVKQKNGKDAAFDTEAEARAFAAENPTKYHVKAPMPYEAELGHGLIEDFAYNFKKSAAENAGRIAKANALERLGKHLIPSENETGSRQVFSREKTDGFSNLAELGIKVPEGLLANNETIKTLMEGYVRNDIAMDLKAAFGARHSLFYILTGRTDFAGKMPEAYWAAEGLARKGQTAWALMRLGKQALVENQFWTYLVSTKAFLDQAGYWKHNLKTVPDFMLRGIEPQEPTWPEFVKEGLNDADSSSSWDPQHRSLLSQIEQMPSVPGQALTLAQKIRFYADTNPVAKFLADDLVVMEKLYHGQDAATKFHVFDTLINKDGMTPAEAADVIRSEGWDFTNSPPIAKVLSKFNPFSAIVTWQGARTTSNMIARRPATMSLKLGLLVALGMAAKRNEGPAGLTDEVKKKLGKFAPKKWTNFVFRTGTPGEVYVFDISGIVPAGEMARVMPEEMDEDSLVNQGIGMSPMMVRPGLEALREKTSLGVPIKESMLGHVAQGLLPQLVRLPYDLYKSLGPDERDKDGKRPHMMMKRGPGELLASKLIPLQRWNIEDRVKASESIMLYRLEDALKAGKGDRARDIEKQINEMGNQVPWGSGRFRRFVAERRTK